jgi:hypothetical protein
MVPDQAARKPMSTRAGRYIRQPAGYRAFIPSPLPPVPPLELGAMLALLSKADRALARLDGSVPASSVLPETTLSTIEALALRSVEGPA